MRRLTFISAIAGVTASLACLEVAHAITVPDSGTCDVEGNGLAITNTGMYGTAINGAATYNGQSWGVWGSSPGPGGYGQFNAAGVYGVNTSTGNGVQGTSTGGGYGVYGYIFGNYSNTAAVYGNSQVLQSYGVQGSSPYVGVEGTGNTYGVQGISISGVGVYGVGGGGTNGVVGANSNTNGAAAAISALSGNATTGLAYWGTGNITITGPTASKLGGGMWAATSDRRVKRDVKDFNQGLAELRGVHPVSFHYNGLGGTTDDGKEFVGVIAQDLEKVLPAMVYAHAGKLHPNDATDTQIKQVNPSNFTYLLINAVKEQQKVIERQEARIEALEQGKPLASSMLPFGPGGALMVGLLPVGVVVAFRRRRKSS